MWCTLRISCFCFECYALYAAAVVYNELQNMREVTAAKREGRRLFALAGIPLQKAIKMVVMAILMAMMKIVIRKQK
jgi:hypothetical protein